MLLKVWVSRVGRGFRLKFYLKVFITALALFSLVFGGMFYAITKNAKETTKPKPPETPIFIADESEEPVQEDTRTELERLVDASDRLNVLAFGVTKEQLADTIMFISYSPSDQLLDVVSIPRDTYHYVAGHDNWDQKKINAVYGFKNSGSLGMKREVSEVLNVPIDYYIRLNYAGVENIVDVLDGVEINVFKHLVYDDPLASPPLHIDIPAGKQVLNGENAVKYLRWRKNNGEDGDGDIGRIKRQQAFVIAAAKKAFSLKLPVVVKTTFNYMKTDMKMDTMIYYATLASEFNFSNVETHRLPGNVKNIDRHSYLIHDPAATEEMMISIYNRVPKKE